MKRLIIAAVAAGLLTAALFAVSSSQSQAGFEPSPFIGAWERIDAVDGIHERLSIGGGRGYRHHIVYFDHSATDCGGDQAIAIGRGHPPDPVMPNTLEAELSRWCLKPHRAYEEWMPTFTYLPDRDVLVQETGGEPIEWMRQGAKTGPTPTPTPGS